MVSLWLTVWFESQIQRCEKRWAHVSKCPKSREEGEMEEEGRRRDHAPWGGGTLSLW